MKNADMPAMPMVALNSKDEPIEVSTFGMTKREMMAMAAMQGLLSRHGDDDYSSEQIARYSVCHADALLSELERAK